MGLYGSNMSHNTSVWGSLEEVRCHGQTQNRGQRAGRFVKIKCALVMFLYVYANMVKMICKDRHVSVNLFVL